MVNGAILRFLFFLFRGASTELTGISSLLNERGVPLYTMSRASRIFGIVMGDIGGAVSSIARAA